METIISALIASGASLLVCIITQAMQARKTEALIDYRLLKLEEKVYKHNSVIDRTYKLEERTEIQEERIKVANHRIEDLEKEVHA